MAEQRFCKPTVVGSTPIIGSTHESTRRSPTETTTMRPLKSIHLSITEARAVRAGRRVFDGGVAQGSEHSLDKREVAGSIPASTTKGTCAGGETPAASLSCGGSTMVVHRSAKSKAAGSSPVPRSVSICTVSPEWKGPGLQPQWHQRQRRFDSVTVLHPMNRPAVGTTATSPFTGC